MNSQQENRYELNKQLAQMLKGGVIMDVTTPEQAKIAETAGACAIMALERIPADIRAAGGVSRMSDPSFQVPFVDCATLPVWQGLYQVIIDYLDSITLQNIMDQHRERHMNDYII